MTSRYSDTLQMLEAEGRLRTLRPLSGKDRCYTTLRGRRMLNLSSNDYLGLAGNSKLQKEFFDSIPDYNFLDRFGLSAASSRLLSGDCDVLHEFENMLAAAYGFDRALYYNSGYHANIGVLPALFERGDLILSDKLNHASIHDGIMLSRAKHKRYRHCDYQHLEYLLRQYRSQHRQAVIVSESVFSMDGDVADLEELVRLKQEYDCLLFVDEAHGIGMYGPRGLGVAEEAGVLNHVDILAGPCGKAFASIGCFILCSADVHNYLVNMSRSMIFTTALPPLVLSWNIFVFQHILDMNNERLHVRQLSNTLRQSLLDNGLQTAGSTNIVPVVIGDSRLALPAADRLQQEGYMVLPVRPPTVPEGTARFRLSVTADMQWDDLAEFAGAARIAVDACRKGTDCEI